MKRQNRLSRDQGEASNPLIAELLRGLDSGKPIPYRAGYFDKKKADLAKKLKQPVDRKSKKTPSRHLSH
jgi:hypothetical protein